MDLITKTSDLEPLCRKLAREPYVTVDTEFMRDRTYWSRLCLVQLGSSDGAVAVDPLADGLDLAPVTALMCDPGVLKVFHAARQDLEIFYRLAGAVPHPVFDTQIAAMVCGYGDEIGYEALVNRVAGAKLDKSSRFTDWAHRPLTSAQLSYALDDVIHLRTVYERLAAKLDKTGRSTWVTEEFEALGDSENYELRPEEAWKRLKFRSRDPRFVAVAQSLAEWRENEAQRRDVPRNRVIRDDLLLEVAASRPKDAQALRKLPRIGVNERTARGIVDAIAAALARPEEGLPRLPAPQRPARGIGPTVDLLRVLLKLRCEENDVAQRLVATVSDLEAIARDDNADVAALHGWRRDLFGEDALALKNGRVALAMRGASVVSLPLPDSRREPSAA